MDTNVLYAALRSRAGASFAILDALERGRWSLLLSQTVLTEYEEVLHRESTALGLDRFRIGRLLDDFCALAELHRTSNQWTSLLSDPADEAFVQLAAEARSDYLISHNCRHLAPAATCGVRVIAPRDFLSILAP